MSRLSTGKAFPIGETSGVSEPMSQTVHHPNGHAVHVNGADGQSLAQAPEFRKNPGQRLIAHLLGTDQQEYSTSGSYEGRQGFRSANAAPSRSVGWNTAMRALNVSNALQGINLTTNFLFLLLFLGFTAWLGVVYWVRHNEPLANSVLGTGAAYSATGRDDRKLLAGIKKTMPVVTSPSTGEIYVPNTPTHAEMFGRPVVVPPVQAPPPVPQPPKPTQLSAGPGAAYGTETFTPPPQYMPQNAYMMPVQHPAGTRVKMIVNR
jgi:hypothetical protein